MYEIAFHDVSFTYPGSSKPALSHVSCRLTLKDKMAVVGLNGAGKTTFIKLLCRLYDPSEGYITLNGVDIRKYDYREYQSLFGVVFQDFHIFPPPGRPKCGGLPKTGRAAGLAVPGPVRRRRAHPGYGAGTGYPGDASGGVR